MGPLGAELGSYDKMAYQKSQHAPKLIRNEQKGNVGSGWQHGPSSYNLVTCSLTVAAATPRREENPRYAFSVRMV